MNELEILQVIKRAAVSAVDAERPVEVSFGTVISENPVQVRLSMKLVLGPKQLIITERMKSLNLKKGDHVVMLRLQGGQSFLMMDKV